MEKAQGLNDNNQALVNPLSKSLQTLSSECTSGFADFLFTMDLSINGSVNKSAVEKHPKLRTPEIFRAGDRRYPDRTEAAPASDARSWQVVGEMLYWEPDGTQMEIVQIPIAVGVQAGAFT